MVTAAGSIRGVDSLSRGKLSLGRGKYDQNVESEWISQQRYDDFLTTDDDPPEADETSAGTDETATAEAADTFVDAEIIRRLQGEVECWARVSPQFRVKIRIAQHLLGKVRLIPGVSFEWSPKRQVARPQTVDQAVLRDIAELERQL